MTGGNGMIIRIKNLRARTVVGVDESERRHRREVVVNVEMEVDAAAAAGSDNLNDTVDYEAVRKRIVQELRGAECCLLEALADRVLRIVLAEPKVVRATVEVDKPGALRSVDSVSVTRRGGKGAC